MKTSFYPESLNADQFEIIKHLHAEEERRQRIYDKIMGTIIFIAIDAILAFGFYQIWAY